MHVTLTTQCRRESIQIQSWDFFFTFSPGHFSWHIFWFWKVSRNVLIDTTTWNGHFRLLSTKKNPFESLYLPTRYDGAITIIERRRKVKEVNNKNEWWKWQGRERGMKTEMKFIRGKKIIGRKEEEKMSFCYILFFTTLSSMRNI